MACNCASSEQIKELYARYGDKRNVKNLSLSGKLKYYTQYAGVAIVMVILFPVLFLYVLYKGAFDDDHKISFRKFFNIKNNVIINAEQ